MANKLLSVTTQGQLVEVESTAPSVQATCSEAIPIYSLVNIYTTGTPSNVSCRKADASQPNAGRAAHGYVLTDGVNGEVVAVYLSGITKTTGVSPGQTIYLSATTPGALTNTAPTTSGYTLQAIGIALNDIDVMVNIERPILRA